MQDEPKLPDVVERDAQEAEELFKKLWESVDSDNNTDTDKVADNVTDVATNIDSTDISQEKDADNDTDDKQASVDNSTDDDDTDFKKWKARYTILKGKYDAEVPRLSHELKELKEHVTSLSKKEEDEQARIANEKDTADFESFKETYGEAFVEKIQKLVEKKFEEKISPYKKEIDNVKEDNIKAAQTTFMNQLDAKAEGWRDLWEGKDPKFIDFLSQSEPSGLYTYGDLLRTYNDKWDSDKMARVFNIYKEQTKQTHTKPTDSQRKLDVPDTLMTPSRSTATPSPSDNKKKIWTESDISKFMLEERQGKYSPEDAEKIWDDILAAPSEGRVR